MQQVGSYSNGEITFQMVCNMPEKLGTERRGEKKKKKLAHELHHDHIRQEKQRAVVVASLVPMVMW